MKTWVSKFAIVIALENWVSRFAICWVSMIVMGGSAVAAGVPRSVLIVMDEREQMETLAAFLKAEGALDSTIVDQSHIPDNWTPYDSVIAYIHGRLDERAELKFLQYANSGGRLILLHHSISGGKATNKHLFGFLGVELSETDKSREPSTPGGHYAWRDPIEQTIVNLRPDHFITSNRVQWPTRARYTSSDQPATESDYPALILHDTEAYVNHKFTDGRAKTVLLGFKWTDDRNGATYMQDRTAWYKRAGKGWVFYFQPGHSTAEFRNASFTQMILNTILWQPSP